ncbi:MAG: sulfur oxidation c-type cytochrome SoxA [Proteobacteria bacterium]|nr:sulfur oxidation c-type cytochrome SoxA [Pseudomonadota bacterium]
MKRQRLGMVAVACAALAAMLALATAASGQDASTQDTAAEIAKYRQLLQDGNPADLWEARGEELWKQKRGPKNVSLERCDLGKGPGVIAGAYTELPRYFADAGRMMDLETRLVWCMETLQGFAPADAMKQPFGNGEKRSTVEALVAYVVAASRGMKMNVSLADPHAQRAYQIGEQIFFFRGATHDFGCVTCHGASDKRIRLQDLPNLTTKADAQRAYTTWPAYRVSQGEFRTMQWRLNDCLRQQRFPDLKFTSEASVALTTYLAYNANGGTMDAPGLKR